MSIQYSYSEQQSLQVVTYIFHSYLLIFKSINFLHNYFVCEEWRGMSCVCVCVCVWGGGGGGGGWNSMSVNSRGVLKHWHNACLQ